MKNCAKYTAKAQKLHRAQKAFRLFVSYSFQLIYWRPTVAASTPQMKKSVSQAASNKTVVAGIRSGFHTEHRTKQIVDVNALQRG